MTMTYEEYEQAKVDKKKADEVSTNQSGAMSLDQYAQYNTTAKAKNTNIGSTIGDAATYIGGGFLETVEGLTDLSRYGVSGIAKLVGADDYAAQVKKAAMQDTTGMLLKDAKNAYTSGSSISDDDLLAGVLTGVGQIGALVGMGGLTGGFGGASTASKATTKVGKIVSKLNQPMIRNTFITSVGSGFTEAYNGGASDLDATLYALIHGSVEAGTELMYGGLGKIGGVGELDDVVRTAITGKLTNEFLAKATDLALSGVFEGLEEVVSGLIDPFAQAIYTKNLDFTSYNTLGNQFVVGMVTSNVIKGGQVIIPKNRLSTTSTPTLEDIDNPVDKQPTMAEIIKPDSVELETTTQITNDINLLETQIDTLQDQLDSEKNVKKQISLIKTIENLKSEKATRVDQLGSISYTNPADNQKFVKSVVATNIVETQNALNDIVKDQQSLGQDKANAKVIAPTSQQQKVSTDLASKMGLQVMFYDGNITIGYMTNSNRIYSNSNPNTPAEKSTSQMIDWTLGHGMVRGLKTQQSDVYDSYVKYVGNAFPVDAKIQYLDTIKNDKYRDYLQQNPDKLYEQMIADDFGESLNDTDFWGELLESDSDLYNKMVTHVISNFDTILSTTFNDTITKEHIESLRDTFLTETLPQADDVIGEDKEDPKVTVTPDQLMSKSNNEGQPLSDQQVDYFKNSKVVDNEGNLLKLYHGSMYGDWTTLKKNKGLFLSDDYRTAKGYTEQDISQDLEPSDIGQTEFKPKVYTLYANIVNPLIIDSEDQQWDMDNLNYDDLVKEEIKKGIHDGIIIKNINDSVEMLYDDTATDVIVFNSNQIKSLDNINPTINDDINDTIPSAKQQLPTAPEVKVEKGDAFSHVVEGTIEKTDIIPDAIKEMMISNSDIAMYKSITNDESTQAAMTRLKEGGPSEVNAWFAKEDGSFDSTDIAEGAIVLDQYIKNKDSVGAVAVMKKIRNAATKGAQRVQAMKIFQRLSPEGMTYYTQSELSETWEKLYNVNDPKIKKWAEDNRDIFTLNETEIQWINKKMTDVQGLDPNSRKSKIANGEIQALVQSKIPPKVGAAIKGWARISMLFNPKTLIRNVLGNVTITPVNMMGDLFGSALDKALGTKTGVRTTGAPQLKVMGKGAIKGISETVDDYQRGIDTNFGDKFEQGQTKSFKDKGIGKGLNEADRLLNTLLGLGDNPFATAAFDNSIANQMRLNKVTKPTESMIDIARTESLQRTWQDKNKLVDGALAARRGANHLKIANYGVGDMISPFILTPVNLVKAIYDYSPAASISIAKDAKAFSNAKKTGQKDIAKYQKRLVNSFSKAMAGTLIYGMAYMFKKAGLITGGKDDDADVTAFMKIAGIQEYSFKLGDKSFRYDWAQPIASPFAIVSDVDNLMKDDMDSNALSKVGKTIMSGLKVGGSSLYEQSVFQSLSTLFGGDDITEGAVKVMSSVPSRFIPTLFGQVASYIDPAKRSTYDYDNIPSSTVKGMLNKIPFVSSLLPQQTDVLGRDMETYGGDVSAFNVFFNPGNAQKSTTTPSAVEIMEVYNATGDKTIIPTLAPSYVKYNNEKYILSTDDKTMWQKTTGTIVNNVVADLITSDAYNDLTYSQKADVINQTISYATERAKLQVIDAFEATSLTTNMDQYADKGLSEGSYMMYKKVISTIDSDRDSEDSAITGSKQGKQAWTVMNMNIDDTEKNIMFDLMTTGKSPATVDDLLSLDTQQQYIDYFALPSTDFFIQKNISREDYQAITDLGINKDVFAEYANTVGTFKADYSNGKMVTDSKKNKVVSYINSLPLSGEQRIYLLGVSGYSVKAYSSTMANYINTLNVSADRKMEIWNNLMD